MGDYADQIARNIISLHDLPDNWGDIETLLAEAVRTGYNLRDGVGA